MQECYCEHLLCLGLNMYIYIDRVLSTQDVDAGPAMRMLTFVTIEWNNFHLALLMQVPGSSSESIASTPKPKPGTTGDLRLRAVPAASIPRDAPDFAAYNQRLAEFKRNIAKALELSIHNTSMASTPSVAAALAAAANGSALVQYEQALRIRYSMQDPAGQSPALSVRSGGYFTDNSCALYVCPSGARAAQGKLTSNGCTWSPDSVWGVHNFKDCCNRHVSTPSASVPTCIMMFIELAHVHVCMWRDLANR